MISSSLFRVTEYECGRLNSEEIIAVYESRPMCLRDAGRYAAALSYARGAYIEVEPTTLGETYHEWYYAGSLCRDAGVPTIRFGKRRLIVSLPPEAEINPHEVDNAIALLKLQGHSVEPYDYAGTILYKIDGYMLITTEEISELCKRVCTIMDAGSQSDVRECH